MTGVMIRGCKITTVGSSGQVTGDGVNLNGAGTIKQVTISDNQVTVINAAGIRANKGAPLGSFTDIVCSNNYVYDFGKKANTEGCGIQFHKSSNNVQILGNTVDTSGSGGGNGIEFVMTSATADAVISSNIVRNIQNTVAYGIAVVQSASDSSTTACRVTISDNSVSSIAGVAGIELSGRAGAVVYGGSISGNVIKTVTNGNGIAVRGVSGVSISNNSITGFADKGVRAGRSTLGGAGVPMGATSPDGRPPAACAHLRLGLRKGR